MPASLRPPCGTRCRVLFGGWQQSFFEPVASVRSLWKEKGACDRAPEASADQSDVRTSPQFSVRSGGKPLARPSRDGTSTS